MLVSRFEEVWVPALTDFLGLEVGEQGQSPAPQQKAAVQALSRQRLPQAG